MSHRRLVDELRDLAPKQRKLGATAEEVERIIEAIEAKAREEAAKGETEVGFRFDNFKRIGELADTQLPRNRVAAIERFFESQGLTARYSDNMSCGMCNMNDCDNKAHYGYVLSWKTR